LRRILKHDEDLRWIIIANPKFKVEFQSNFIREDDIRQLLEKYLTGKIGYNDEIKDEGLKVGEYLPPIKMLDLNTGKEVSITDESDESPNLWIIFTSKCISCVFRSHLSMYSIIEKQIQSLNIQPGLIFSAYFDKEEIIR
jgi:hypothetical protein